MSNFRTKEEAEAAAERAIAQRVEMRLERDSVLRRCAFALERSDNEISQHNFEVYKLESALSGIAQLLGVADKYHERMLDEIRDEIRALIRSRRTKQNPKPRTQKARKAR
jgi:light-regulated signal transduction histidine kinase (bacteriophytochrome)